MPKGPIESALGGGAGSDGGDGTIFDGSGGGTYDVVRPESLLACANCGAVFLKRKIESKLDLNGLLAPKYSDVSCPVCLTTQGWDQVQ